MAKRLYSQCPLLRTRASLLVLPSLPQTVNGSIWSPSSTLAACSLVHLQTSHIHGGSLRLQKETLWNWETDPAKIKGQLVIQSCFGEKKEMLMQFWSILTQLFRDHHLHKKPLKYIPRKPQRSHRAYVQCKVMEKSRHPPTGRRHSLLWRATLKSVFLIVCLHSFFLYIVWF